MATMTMRGRAMERKTISISSKRQVTIPQKFFDALGFNKEAECIFNGNELVIRPMREQSGGEFAEQILTELVAKGYSGNELLEKFKEEQRKVRPAVLGMIAEADALAKSSEAGPSFEDLFDTED